MKISNSDHITLHAEAQELLDQAEQAGWEEAYINLLPGDKYPTLCLWMDDVLLVLVHTIPHFSYYTVSGEGGSRVEFRDLPLVSPAQVQSIRELLNSLATQFNSPHATAQRGPQGGWIGCYDGRPVTPPVRGYRQALNLAWEEMHGNDRD
jgi:hypothetical protein